MEKVKIITDSTCDLPLDVIKQYDIEVIPLLISFGEEIYKDKVDINTEEMFERVKNGDIFPKTCQIIPQRFCEVYQKYLNEGYKIISIHISSKMSGTYQSACIAKMMLETEDITVIDSMNVTSGLGIIVIKACKLREAKCSVKEIEEKIIEIEPHVKSVLSFDMLEHLVKGGRLSKTAGVVGNILSIKPILAVKDGEMAVIDKVRGTKKALKYILDYLDNGDINKQETSILLNAHKQEIKDALFPELEKRNMNFVCAEVGCVVGVHSGPGACGVFYIEEY